MPPGVGGQAARLKTSLRVCLQHRGGRSRLLRAEYGEADTGFTDQRGIINGSPTPQPEITREDQDYYIDALDVISLGCFEQGVPVIMGLFPNDYEGESDVYFPSANFLHLLYTREVQMPKLKLRRPPHIPYVGADACRQWLANAATQPPMPQAWVRIPALIASGRWLDLPLREGAWNGGSLADVNALYIELPEPVLTGEEDEADIKSWGYTRHNHFTPGCSVCTFVESLHWPAEQIAMTDYLLTLLEINDRVIRPWRQEQHVVKVYGDGVGDIYRNVSLLVTTVAEDHEVLTPLNCKTAVIVCDIFHDSTIAEIYAIFLVSKIATALIMQGLVVRAPRNDCKTQVNNFIRERVAYCSMYWAPIACLYEAMRHCRSTRAISVIDQALPIYEHRETETYVLV